MIVKSQHITSMGLTFSLIMIGIIVPPVPKYPN